ncbi:hypothetical protein EV360DRAFT_89174 [Lentinula raphanica]|nr:hypothetical protein EV360DRAFT_89174 [Lentinula raphanica]
MKRGQKKRTTDNSKRASYTPREGDATSSSKPSLLRHPLRQSIPTTSPAPDLSLPLPTTPSRSNIGVTENPSLTPVNSPEPELDTYPIDTNPFELRAPPPSKTPSINFEADLSPIPGQYFENPMTSTATETRGKDKGKRREVETESVEEYVESLLKPIEADPEPEGEELAKEEAELTPEEVLQQRYRMLKLRKVSDYYVGDYSDVPQRAIAANPEVEIVSFYEEDGSIPLSYASFTGQFDYRDIPESHCAHLRDRRKEAVRLGSQFLRRPGLVNFEANPLSRTERKRFSKELELLNKFLTYWRRVEVDKEEVAYAVVPENYIELLKALRQLLMDSRLDYQVRGLPLPEIPYWGKNALVAQWWDFNDLECIGACWRVQVERFLKDIAKNTDKPHKNIEVGKDTQKSRAPGRVVGTRDVRPTMITDDPGSISQFKKVRSEQYDTLRGTLRAHNKPNIGYISTASKQFTEQFGTRDQRQRYPISDPGRAPSRASRHSNVSNRPVDSGKDNSGDGPPSDSSDGSGDEGEDGPGRNNGQGPPRRPGRDMNPPGGDPEGDPQGGGGGGGPGNGGNGDRQEGFEIGRARHFAMTDPPRFDNKLKADLIPTWNGDMDRIITWETQLNDLAKRSDIVHQQLGYLVPTRFRESAEEWYYSLSEKRRRELEHDWTTLRDGINRYYMNRKWMDDQKISANKATYRNKGHYQETPSEYFIRKKELLMRVYDYTDTQLIQEVMEGAPTSWINIVTPHLYQDIDEFQEVIKFHENALMSLTRPYRDYYRENDNGNKPGFTKARVNLVGSSKNLPPPQYPKDDSIVSKRQTPEEAGGRPCRHCGSHKHWDYECRYSRRGMRKARMNHIECEQEDIEAQQRYDDLYYGLASDDESEKEDF